METRSHLSTNYWALRQWHPTPVLLPGKSRRWRSLEGCSPWGRWGSDTTERLHFQFSLSCIGEGNGNPLQCSCLENPRDGGAWWTAVYGVAQSQTQLKWRSSGSSSSMHTPRVVPKFSLRLLKQQWIRDYTYIRVCIEPPIYPQVEKKILLKTTVLSKNTVISVLIKSEKSQTKTKGYIEEKYQV